MKNGKRAVVLSVALFAALGWLPVKRTTAEGRFALSKAECVMEMHSRRVLYEWKGDLRLPMASTTKIVTCATVLQDCKNLQEEITIPEEAEGVEGSSVYLKSGEKYTVESLLYGLMLRSGNDCATALALHFGGSIGNFSAKMNAYAQKAGAICSNFENPHGLPQADHYTTARDLTLVSCLAMQNEKFREIVATQYYAPYHWKNKNKMLQTLDGCVGIKTGYTKQAGRCLVTAATRQGMTLVCSVLNSPVMYERSTELLEDAFAAYKYTTLLAANQPIELENGKTGIAKRDYAYPLLEEEQALTEIVTTTYTDRKNGEIVGQFQIYLAKRLLFSGNLYKI